ncbi:hypothetical protein GCM10010339_94990 [Streptomyces alanosinicus]|uniref:Uncharacterized protein n=1 Tax=Streptomyces alanosinicus TaxID=68171 RepID=A0A918IRM1_9ACTN|nr:hypothetical protein GCM10010339_94990 [Streptomyces alanosinicus]
MHDPLMTELKRYLVQSVGASHGTARLVGLLLGLLLPAPGRHRTPTSHPVTPSPETLTVSLPRSSMLRGEDNVLVRPYLVAHERREEERRQRARRRTLVLAT